MKLSTQRLELVAATYEHIQAELESLEKLAALLDVEIEPGWPPGEYDRGAQEFFRDILEKADSDTASWYLWYAIRKTTPDQKSTLIGAGGYLGMPNENGEVEVGFSIVPSHRELGYATEMAQALVDRAFADRRVCKVLAHTTPQNSASRRVLAKAGFQVDNSSEDPECLCFEICRDETPISDRHHR